MRSIYYFTMYLCYVSKLFILFLMCQNFLLYFTTICIFMFPCFYSISPYFYVYVSKLLALFHYTVCLCFQAFYPVSYVSELFTLFHHTILYIMFPCFHSISPYLYVYVSKLLALFHYTDMLCFQAFYSVSYVSELFTLFHHIYYVCLCVRICVLFHRAY